MYVRHVPHSGPLQLLAHGRWHEVFATLEACVLSLEGAVGSRSGMRIPIDSLRRPPAQPSAIPAAASREHSFQLELLTDGGSAPTAVHLAARTRSELNIWLLRIGRALADARPPPPPPLVEAPPPLPLSQVQWPHGTAGVPSLVSPSYPPWVEGPRPEPYRGRTRKPTFQWQLSDEALLRLVGKLPAEFQTADGPAGRPAPPGAAHDYQLAHAGHYRGSARGRAVALLQELAAGEHGKFSHPAAVGGATDGVLAPPAPLRTYRGQPEGYGREYREWLQNAANANAPQLHTTERARERAVLPPTAARLTTAAELGAQRRARQAWA
ncbi:hypothetical protein T492DRAFT_1057679 [Pavlovales sp. CCMP2436]|nr:hypothetical protein T492DRAFT_1057679 [Pavlovales sp. CCMP2436]